MGMGRAVILDEIKGLAIIAVVLFHLGVFAPGYVGVDVFLVVAGYLTAQSVEQALGKGRFSSGSFIFNRVKRLLPLVLLAGFVSLAIGYVVMIPDDYENLSQGVVATNCFSNNILCRIASSDYWNPRNDFKSLLHFWYLGVLMQLYVMYVLLVLVAKFVGRWLDARKTMVIMLAIGFLVSAMLWFGEIGSQPVRFYYMPWRFWEFGMGALLFYFGIRIPERNSLRIPYLALIGSMSFSIYVWHYVILAFARYVFAPELSIEFVVIYLFIVALVSAASYRFLERAKIGFPLIFLCWLILTAAGYALYLRGGVVRDIPELDVDVGKAERGIHSAYNSRVYKCAGQFENDGRRKVLVVGNSFARDWSNVLFESTWSNKIDLIYRCQKNEHMKDIEKVYDEADVVFLAGYYPELFPEPLQRFIAGDVKEGQGKTYVVGDKWFGYSNGAFYSRRFFKDYFKQTVEPPQELLERNRLISGRLGKFYIDMIEVLLEDGRLPVFSDEHKLISQDCVHLTRGGARFYAKKLDVAGLLGN